MTMCFCDASVYFGKYLIIFGYYDVPRAMLPHFIIHPANCPVALVGVTRTILRSFCTCVVDISCLLCLTFYSWSGKNILGILHMARTAITIPLILPFLLCGEMMCLCHVYSTWRKNMIQGFSQRVCIISDTRCCVLLLTLLPLYSK